VRNDLRHRPYPEGYSVSKRWRAILDDAMQRAGQVADDPIEVAKIGMRLFDLPHEVVDDKRAEQLRKSRSEFMTRNPELALISDSKLAHPAAVIEVDGVTYSAQIEQAFEYYEDIKAGIGDTAALKVIVEVGSGFGRLGRLMNLLDRTRQYILVDLPESLVFAYAFLRINFPQSRMSVIDAPDHVVSDLAESHFVFCPIQYLSALRSRPVDVVINTYSFAEMPQGCVNYILNWVEQSLKPQFLYSLNMVFSDKTIHYDTGGLDGDANETVLSLRPQWFPTRWVLLPSVAKGKYRVTGSIVLQHVSTRPQVLIADLRSAADACRERPHERLGYLYLAALWSKNRRLADEFLEELRHALSGFGFGVTQGFDFNRIGEVIVLQRAVNSC
jgi:putative sugar O-methyltransferase